MVRIALDAMGGDRAPQVTVEGAISAARELGCQITLVGDKVCIEKELRKYDIKGLTVSICHTDEVIAMSERPVEACRTKKKATIMEAMRLTVEGKADAVVSAGNSGAAMTAALWYLRRLPGVSRPAIATVLPTLTGSCLLLDVGANVDCKPKHLYQFAVMGSIYAQAAFHFKNPRVGLLSIGEEEGKGNELVMETNKLLKASSLNYIGNMEGRDILSGAVDVVVCDGFTGNVVLKFGEGLAEALLTLIREEIRKHPVARLSAKLFLRGVFKDIWAKVDYAEYGGALLLGVKGVAIISHGGSKAKAIKNAIRAACELVQQNINQSISEKLHSVMEASQCSVACDSGGEVDAF